MVHSKVKKNLHPDEGYAAAFSADEIFSQLERILASPDFDATTMQRAFLTFVLEQTLGGYSQNIKGYTIATQVFGRNKSFDQAIDPIVSIQANKLRRALERYYLLSGKEDALRIAIPKGTYVPVFSKKKSAETSTPSRRIVDRKVDLNESWPALLIKPFLNLTNQPEKNYLGAGFAAELAMEINRFQWIAVMQYSPDGKGRRSSDSGARFIVQGSIREDETGIKVVVNLLDAKTNRQLWSETLRYNGELTKIIAFQEEVASVVGAIIAGELGIIARTLAVETKKRMPAQFKTYEAILCFHEYEQTLSPESFTSALTALEQARINEPECGQVWSFLARLYANIFSLEIPGFDISDAEQKALAFAEMGARLNPDSQGAMGVLALVRMFSNQIAAARRVINQAYALNPDSLYLMDGIGYVKALLGEWETGTALIRKTIRLNPYYRPVVHYALWLDYLRQHDFQNAYLETTELRRPAVFWYPLAKASTLGLLGRTQEGEKYAGDLLKLKPDFRERGRVLIERYIKFEDIVAMVFKGLGSVGIVLE